MHLYRYCRHVYADNMERSIPPDSTSYIPFLSGKLGYEGEGPVESAAVPRSPFVVPVTCYLTALPHSPEYHT